MTHFPDTNFTEILLQDGEENIRQRKPAQYLDAFASSFVWCMGRLITYHILAINFNHL